MWLCGASHTATKELVHVLAGVCYSWICGGFPDTHDALLGFPSASMIVVVQCRCAVRTRVRSAQDLPWMRVWMRREYQGSARCDGEGLLAVGVGKCSTNPLHGILGLPTGSLRLRRCLARVELHVDINIYLVRGRGVHVFNGHGGYDGERLKSSLQVPAPQVQVPVVCMCLQVLSRWLISQGCNGMGSMAY
jgi:hypothetical protein